MADLEHTLGKRYRPFEYTGASDADYVIVTMGVVGPVFADIARELNRAGKV